MNRGLPSSSRTRASEIVAGRAPLPARVARLGDLARDLAADRADLALELAHAGLARVVAR